MSLRLEIRMIWQIYSWTATGIRQGPIMFKDSFIARFACIAMISNLFPIFSHRFPCSRTPSSCSSRLWSRRKPQWKSPGTGSGSVKRKWGMTLDGARAMSQSWWVGFMFLLRFCQAQCFNQCTCVSVQSIHQAQGPHCWRKEIVWGQEGHAHQAWKLLKPIGCDVDQVVIDWCHVSTMKKYVSTKNGCPRFVGTSL